MIHGIQLASFPFLVKIALELDHEVANRCAQLDIALGRCRKLVTVDVLLSYWEQFGSECTIDIFLISPTYSLTFLSGLVQPPRYASGKVSPTFMKSIT